MAALTPIAGTRLVDWLLEARHRRLSGVLVVRPPLQPPFQITLDGGAARHVAPDLDVIAGAGADPAARDSTIEVARDLVAGRLRDAAALRDGEFGFIGASPSAAMAGLPLRVDVAPALLASFDGDHADVEQAALLGRRWDERLAPGPRYADLLDAFLIAFPQGPVTDAIERGLTITALAAGAPDALVLLRRVYAAVATGVAQLAPGRVVTPADAGPLPWSPDEDLVVAGGGDVPPPSAEKAERRVQAPVRGSQEELDTLLAVARDEDDPWIGVDAYPDVAERVVRRDARVRSGQSPERRSRSGVSQLIRPESADVALNLDLVRDDPHTATAHWVSPAPGAPGEGRVPTLIPAPTPVGGGPEPPRSPSPRPPPPPEDEAASGGRSRVLTVPGAAPTRPAPAPPPPPLVLTTPPGAPAAGPARPSTTQAAPALSPPGTPPRAAPGGAVAAASPSQEDEERLAALHDWLRAVGPHLQAEEYYRALGVAPGASGAEIAQKHRDLVVKFHPDRFERFALGADGARLVEAWGALNKAMGVLTDDARRREYDIYIDRKRRGLPTDAAVVMRAEATYLEGERLLRAGRFSEAVARYDEAIALNSEDAEFHAARAWAELQAARPKAPAGSPPGTAPPVPPGPVRQRARAVLEGVLKQRQNFDRACYYLGLIAQMDGDDARAAEQFRKATELNPDHVEARRELRLMRMRSGADAAGQAGPGKAEGGLFGRGRKS